MTINIKLKKGFFTTPIDFPEFELSPNDVLEFSIQFEERSRIFYENLSKLMKDPETQDLFRILAKEEVKHIETFTKMLGDSSIKAYGIKSIPEHIDYLHNFLNTTIFSKDMLSVKLQRVRDIETSFEFSMSIELDQILFYNEIRNYLSDRHKGVIDEVIEEERRHFVKIMQIKQQKGY